MAKVPITVMGYRCDRCGHEWLPRGDVKDPKVCPKCHSPWWDTPKKGAATTYEDFRDRIRQVLAKSDQPLSWTAIRTKAKLPQAFPNNQWVRRLETDIRLLRERDKDGIMLWSLKQE